MKRTKKFTKSIIAVVICILLATTAWATEQILVNYTATLSKDVICAGELTEAKTVTLTAQAGEDISMDAFTAMVSVPEGWEITDIANSKLNFGDSNFNLANGMILWYSSTAENVENDLLATVTVKIPAGTVPGEYEIEFLIIDISRDFGMPWENDKTLTAKLTVAEHVDGNDANHDCDNCPGAVAGETCAKYAEVVTGKAATCAEAGWNDYYQCSVCGKLYSDAAATTEIPDLEAWKTGDGAIAATGNHVYVPGEYAWSNDYSACTVTGTCACGTATDTATAIITSEVTTTATCMAEEKTTYTATFDKDWAKTQTNEVVTGGKNPDVHTGNYHIEGKKEATVDKDGYTGDIYCECEAMIEKGKSIGKHQIKATEVENFEKVPEEAGEVFESVEVMQNAMVTKVQAAYAEELAGKTVTTEYYDVDLTYYDVETESWQEADKEHFPENGKLLVEIEVSDVAHHTYYVAHVFSTGDFGGEAGDIECPVVTEYTDPVTEKHYIRFEVTGLSPISVSYVKNDCVWVDNGYTDNGNGTHTHNYKCDIAGCTETKSDEPVAHDFTAGGNCVCGAAHVCNWIVSGYTDNNDGTHTAHYVCQYNDTHTKSDETAAHDFTTGDCVCGAVEPTGLKGDVDLNGVVDMDDVITLLCHVMKVDGEMISDPNVLALGEVTGDTSLDMDDVIKILQYVMKAGVDSLD